MQIGAEHFGWFLAFAQCSLLHPDPANTRSSGRIADIEYPDYRPGFAITAPDRADPVM